MSHCQLTHMLCRQQNMGCIDYTYDADFIIII